MTLTTWGTAGIGRKSLSKIHDEAIYYPHQVDGIREMARMTSFLLADEMGLGKSIQALTVAAIDFERGWAKSVLVVAPASLKWNWAEEVEKHTYFSCTVLDGTAKQRAVQLAEFAEGGTDILIVNYEQVKPHLEELNRQRFDIAIFDEAHYIKNKGAQRTKAAHGLKVKRAFVLTGSPLLNQVNDLWGLLHRVDPAAYPNYWRFCNTPEAPIWMADGSFLPIGKIQVGDMVMGWEAGTNGRRQLVHSRVEWVQPRVAPMVIKATMKSGRSVRCTPDHQWLSGNHNPYHEWVSINGDNPLRKGTLSHVVDVLPDPTPEQQREMDWLSGLYDGEGSRYNIAQYQGHNPEVCDRIERALTVLEIPFSRNDLSFNLTGGRSTWVKLLNWGNMTKRGWFESRLTTQLNRTKDKVVSVEEQGPGEVISMQTSTGNYVAWGYASKNCNRYAVFGGYKDKQIVGVKNKAELVEQVDRVMIRRLKKDVLDLPEKMVIPVLVDFHPTQEKYYKQAEDELKIDLPDNPNPMEIENVLSKLLRLKQICGTPACIGAEDHSYKLDRAVEMIEELLHDDDDSPGEHVVVFTQFRGVLEAMQQRLDALGILSYTLHGDVPMKERQGVVSAWSGGKPAVMLAMLQVAGVGLNMTTARSAIFLDRLWTPKLNEQAEDRMHRIGADKSKGPIEIYNIIVRKSVEQRIEQILRRKTKLFDTVIEDSEWKKMLAAALSEED